MSQMIGANPQELRQLAAFLRKTASNLDGTTASVGEALSRTDWRGGDASTFRNLWSSSLRRKLNASVHTLNEAAKTLERNARDQEQASAGSGGGSRDGERPRGWWGSAQKVGTRGEVKILRGSYGTDTWHRGQNNIVKGSPSDKRWDGDTSKTSVNVELINAKGDISLADVRGGYEGEYGSAEGRLRGPFVEGTLSAGIRDNNAEASVGVAVGLASVSGTAALNYGIASASAKGEASVVAEAKGTVRAGKDGMEASGEAFAGAKVKGEVGGDIGGVGGKLKGEAWAGAGVSGEAKFSTDNGKLTIGLSGGVGLGVGAKAGFEITIDPVKIVQSVSDIGSAVGNFFSSWPKR